MGLKKKLFKRIQSLILKIEIQIGHKIRTNPEESFFADF